MAGLAAHVAEIARRHHPQHAVPEELSEHCTAMGAVAVALAHGASEVLLSRDSRRAAQSRQDDAAMDDLHDQLLAVFIDRGWRHDEAAAVDVALLGRF